MGDVIYALPVLRHMQPHGFSLILGTKTRTRRPFDKAWAENLASLLAIQPYIKDVRLQKPGDRWIGDCDQFRPLLIRKWVRGRTITSYVCELFGVPWAVGDTQWLTVDYPLVIEECPVIINRTHRYRNHRFPWHKVYHKYQERCAFVGTLDEYDTFQREVGPLPYCETPTLLDVARVIAGSKLFVGNQSVAYAIAEGLKHTVVQETNPKLCDCMFRRHNAFFGFDANVKLPDI